MPLARARRRSIQSVQLLPLRVVREGPGKGEAVRMASLLLPRALVSIGAAGPQKNAKDPSSDKKPKLALKAQPVIAMSPARIVLTAELVGGPNDYEEFYCPTVEWDWGDGTQSESTNDCAPFESGKTEIK